MRNTNREATKQIAKRTVFTTPDGQNHLTWGAARKHLTHTALITDVASWLRKWWPRDGVPPPDNPPPFEELMEAHAADLVKDLTHAWNVSRRLGPKGRPRRLPR